MAKISPVSIKYIIHARFEAEGTLEKPDVIGALFGQTEGLLGEELELRELQKEGKIGRIDVNLRPDNGKTVGDIQIPSSIDKAETTIIAAALETIERIGPSDSKITIERIEDVRGSKREYIIERAKRLLERIEGTSDSREIEQEVRLSSRTGKLQEYGKDRLPAGDVSGKEIVVVEGRADVVNLLRANVLNVIAMNGTILPETIKELSYEKEVTLFVDGDRGGKLIAKNAIENTKVDYVAVAPDGKEVEELSPKEILSELRKKMKAEEFLEKTDNGKNNKKSYRTRARKEEKAEFRELSDEDIDKIRVKAEEIKGSKAALLLNENLEVIRRVPASRLYSLRNKDIFVLVVDGTATANIVKNAEKMRVQNLAATNFGYTDTNLKLVSL